MASLWRLPSLRRAHCPVLSHGHTLSFITLRYHDQNFTRAQNIIRHLSTIGTTQRVDQFCMRKEALRRPLAVKVSYLVPDPIALEALKNNNANPLSVWQASVARGSATVTTAVQCLAAYLHTLEGMGQGDVQQKVQADETGRRLLRWLWLDIDRSDETKYRRHIHDAMNHPAFLFELAYLLIEEGNEKYLWDWMQTDAKEYDDPITYTAHFSAQESKSRAGGHFNWRGTLLRSIIRARLHQAREYRLLSADNALRDFWTAHDLRARFPSGSVQRKMSLTPAVVELCNNITVPEFRNTDPVQWDRFRMFVEYYDRYKTQRLTKLACARLDMYHPKSPDLASAMRIVRGFPEQITANSPTRSDLTFHNHLEALLCNTKVLAARMGMLAERDEIEALHARLMQEWKPHIWQYRYGTGNENQLVRRVYRG
ncbi:hypothetical protein CB0940_11130 [Cercospora beticola]|uniref:Uncharacterized protein n=2 Tax=Cercospora beticola TaxID=122368 RepID=A0A2G5HFE9_CERBT|nr:hypothetical protein CB0940_11130 [Cercospora beticola]PIA90963.1 hypothetical protein CB0940_11130 [Cercospora beticola]CAK1368190.1 unnamed protein product [Cercospora beticola]